MHLLHQLEESILGKYQHPSLIILQGRIQHKMNLLSHKTQPLRTPRRSRKYETHPRVAWPSHYWLHFASPGGLSRREIFYHLDQSPQECFQTFWPRLPKTESSGNEAELLSQQATLPFWYTTFLHTPSWSHHWDEQVSRATVSQSQCWNLSLRENMAPSQPANLSLQKLSGTTIRKWRPPKRENRRVRLRMKMKNHWENWWVTDWSSLQCVSRSYEVPV